MRSLVALAAVAALTVTQPVAAAAAGPPEGAPCKFHSVQADAVGGDAWNAVLIGGPLVAAGEQVSVTCAIRVGDTRYSAPAAASVTGPVLPSVGVVAPTAVSFRADDADPIALCTSATVGATTWHWDGRAWSTDSGASCPTTQWALGTVLDAVPEPLWPFVGYAACFLYPWLVAQGDTSCDLLDALWEDVYAVGQAADQVVCPALAAFSGTYGAVEIRPDGDVYVVGGLFWDCPPYQDPGT